MLRGEAARHRLTTMVSMLGALGFVTACVERPRESDCRAMADHVVTLHRDRHEGRAAELAAELAAEGHPKLVATCIEEGTLTEVQCVLETSAIAELAQCKPR